MSTSKHNSPGSSLSRRELHAISKAVADERRYQILEQIASQACVACSDLRGSFPVTAATLSHHLKELEACGLIETERSGKFVHVTFCRKRWEAYLQKLAEI